MFVPKVSVGLLPNRPVPVPKEGALVVVVPNPAGLLPNRFCKKKKLIKKNKKIIYNLPNYNKTNARGHLCRQKSEVFHQSPVYPHSQSQC